VAVKRDFTGGGRAWASGNGGHWNSNTRPLGACSRATSGGGGSSKGVLAVGSGDLILVAGGGSNRSAGEALLAQFVSRRGRNEQLSVFMLQKGGTPRKEEDEESEARRLDDKPAADGVASSITMNHGTVGNWD